VAVEITIFSRESKSRATVAAEDFNNSDGIDVTG
jgi:hypothetical protein